jgi:exodeoxyribonuclease VII large subunit
LLLTRGGGSLEDLWCFNDEAVVRAIFALPLPVVSGVGHEIDTTLADFAADLRAPTPSAAAELLVPDRLELHAALNGQHARLHAAMRRRLDGAAQRADRAALLLQVSRPHARLEQGALRMAALQRRLAEQMQRSLRRGRERLDSIDVHLRILHPRQTLRLLGDRLARGSIALHRSVAERLAQQRLHIEGVARALDAVSPLATLRRGFAVLRDNDGIIVRSVAQAHPDQSLTATLADGSVALRVEPSS